MNLHGRIDMSSLGGRLWWAMLAGCATRFAAERSAEQAVSGLLFWVLVFALCFVLRSAVQRRENPKASAQQLGNIVAVGGMLLFLLRLSTDGIVPALLTFLFAIQAALFIVAEKRMHVWLILSAAFAGVLFAAAESRSPLFLLGAAWFTFAALGVLALDCRGERERNTLLKPLAKPGRAAGGLTYGAVALLLAVPLYLFVPKPGGLLLGGMQAKTANDYRDVPDEASTPRDGPFDSRAPAGVDETPSSELDPVASAEESTAGGAAYTDGLSVTEVQRRSSTANAIVLYVKSSRPVYLRGRVYDQFEQDRWVREAHPSELIQLRRGFHERSGAAASPFIVKQTIEVAANMADSVLVHAPDLRRLRFPGPSVRSFDDGMFEAPRPLLRDTTYSVQSQLDLDAGRYVIREPGPAASGRYGHVPADVSDRLRELARSVAAGAMDPRGKALALEDYLRTNYRYSYETIRQQGHTPLDWFLFEGKRGHCEFFASALAMMLRAVNIESRVVTGFSLGEKNPVTGYYEVRALDGHAWVEARLPGTGWLMLEPTPFYPLPSPEVEEQVAEQMDRYLDRLADTSKVLDPESLQTSVKLAAREAWRQARLAMQQVTSLPQQFGWYLPLMMLAAVLVFIAGYLLLLLAADVLENRQVRQALDKAARSDTLVATQLLAAALDSAGTPRGFGRKPGWTFREYVQNLSRTPNAVPREFAEAFDIARYGEPAGLSDNRTLNAVGAVVETALRRNRWPRLARAVRYWSTLGTARPE